MSIVFIDGCSTRKQRAQSDKCCKALEHATQTDFQFIGNYRFYRTIPIRLFFFCENTIAVLCLLYLWHYQIPTDQLHHFNSAKLTNLNELN